MSKLLLLVCSACLFLLLAANTAAGYEEESSRSPCDDDTRQDGYPCPPKDPPQLKKPTKTRFPKRWEPHARRLLNPFGKHNRVLVSLPYPNDERTPPKKERPVEKPEKPTDCPCKSKKTKPCEEPEKQPCSKVPKIMSALNVLRQMKEMLGVLE